MTKQPNIIMILSDELRADALGCFGNPIVQTPNIDRLAANGTRFSQCMVTQPTCTPSRASILSGCYPSALRTRMVGCYTPEDHRFLPLVLANHGYRTASIGKIHLVPQAMEPEIVAQKLSSGERSYFGFQEVDLVNGHGSRCFGNHYSTWLRERVTNVEARLDETIPYENGLNCWHWNLPEDVHSSHYIADRAIDFLNSADGSPFFLHVSFPIPTIPLPFRSLLPAYMILLTCRRRYLPLPSRITCRSCTSKSMQVRSRRQRLHLDQPTALSVRHRMSTPPARLKTGSK